MANTYEALGDTEQAFLHAQKAFDLKPDDPTPSYNLARISNSAIPQILAKAHWDQYYSLDDKEYFRVEKNWEETREAYMKTLKAFPDSNETHNWLARTAYLAGDYDVAKQAFESAGDDWSSDCWGNLRHFRKVKEKVFGLSGDDK